MREEAAELLKKLDRIGKPLVLKYRAVDEREVDLNNLKGKVVLVDFRATWCAPCVAELPRIQDIYDRLNAQGFDIVGISFNQQKDSLVKFVSQQKMPWPQSFDGKGWVNQFGREIGGRHSHVLVSEQGLRAG